MGETVGVVVNCPARSGAGICLDFCLNNCRLGLSTSGLESNGCHVDSVGVDCQGVRRTLVSWCGGDPDGGSCEQTASEFNLESPHRVQPQCRPTGRPPCQTIIAAIQYTGFRRDIHFHGSGPVRGKNPVQPVFWVRTKITGLHSAIAVQTIRCVDGKSVFRT